MRSLLMVLVLFSATCVAQDELSTGREPQTNGHDVARGQHKR